MDKIQQIEKLFLYIAIYSYLIPVIILFFLKRKKKLPIAIAVYCLIAFILLSIFDFLPRKLQSIYLSVYTLFEYLSFAYMLAVSIQNKKLKKVILILSIGFFIFQVIFGYVEKAGLDSVSVGIETILILIFIFLFFYDQSRNEKTEFIYNHPAFWLSVGMLLYLGGTLFFNILVNYMSTEELDNYLPYTYVIETVKNLLFIKAMWIIYRHHKTNTKNEISKVPYLDLDMN